MLRFILFIIFIFTYSLELNSQDINITLKPSFEKFQTVDGFGGGLKRRTEHIVGLDQSLKDQLYQKHFRLR